MVYLVEQHGEVVNNSIYIVMLHGAASPVEKKIQKYVVCMSNVKTCAYMLVYQQQQRFLIEWPSIYRSVACTDMEVLD